MWWYGDGNVGAWGYVLMTLSMIAFWGLIIYGVVLLARSAGRPDQRADRRLTADDVLADRFARGEIDEQEYRQRLDTLRSHGGTGLAR